MQIRGVFDEIRLKSSVPSISAPPGGSASKFMSACREEPHQAISYSTAKFNVQLKLEDQSESKPP